ncbi:MAG: hypothetical protein Q4Q19_03325 [Methanobrevibacter sp.]|nr:hypothetical protein [Methanobrevibacter sp.]MDO5827273.1 hypothetical protein [Methanobrevibacter sp.]
MSKDNKRATISISQDNKNRLRNIADEDISFNNIVAYLLDVYEAHCEDVPNIYHYLEMDVI